MTDVVGYPVAIRNARAAVTWPRLAGGLAQIYSAPRPAENGGALSGQTLLAEYALPDPVGEIADGVFTGAAIQPAIILADGTPAWCRCQASDGDVVCDLDVGLDGTGEAVELDNLTLVSGARLSITSFVVVEG